LTYAKRMRRCIVTFFDTNVLVYFTINQEQAKWELAKKYIYNALDEEKFFISPMVLSEYIFILAKYKVIKQHQDKVMFFSQYVEGNIDTSRVVDAYSTCQEIDFCKNINDVIHLKIAEEYCIKLVTFDSDFKKLQKYTEIEIEIL